ncbi:DAO-domain-containing protein [Saitoella complicata NRRL Y-17804]|uniref:Rieske domain-containing protein n=1 Tax=Saitoella complicata (strain BCRC 22490 / CBS 7301 / JCM 7358 / NBRC 10748 / NRRL Y-17804) TaxID=698492 RepID=A0A0E9N803_SAICN|nr:DAO-domain-containing protein [Saitoella complicata NRRL Y-17804]ODQ54391.1 DAO-domain-containing protein [Saitoella complicata NRRL Y-17804]GAO45851.1 hypothetical protein G7K_0099-t1 [Saitoella complicata NRRL Y-17804]
MDFTSGANIPVWTATEPYSDLPRFSKLDTNTDTDVVVVGGGIAGLQTAYELVQRNVRVILLEARELLSGETGRTSGHLSNALDDHYYELINTFNLAGAKLAAESHAWAIDRVKTISTELRIDCEYRKVKAVMLKHPEMENDLKDEAEAAEKCGLSVTYEENGKFGRDYHGPILNFGDQAVFHPTHYLVGLIKYLKTNSLFQAYTHTRFISHKEHSATSVTVETEEGNKIAAKALIMATNVPLQKLDVIDKEGFWRTYSIAMTAPKGLYDDLIVYDNADPYVYVRKTAHPNPELEYIVIGGEDHKVAQESPEGYEEHYKNLEAWTRDMFPYVKNVEFKWSGQIVEPNDYMAFIGLNPGAKCTYIATGDSGNGLTHAVIAGRLLSDLYTGQENPWVDLYSPSRKPKPRTITDVVQENLTQAYSGLKKWVLTDVSDIESIPRCTGAIMHDTFSHGAQPLAIYKEADGTTRTFSAVCPHMKGVVAWNSTEGTWDCGFHGSRFEGKTGVCVAGPSNQGLRPIDEGATRGPLEVEVEVEV